MVRIVGILCGSALAISSLIIVLGLPEFLPDPVETPAPDTLPAVASSESEAPEPEPESAAPPDSAVDSPPALEPEIIADTPPTPVFETESRPAQSIEHWYAFWSPFRSELAANGFVSQLQRSTGIDYRVVQLKPGVYEVAFAYEDDADIASRLAEISAATGLDLPDG